MENVLIGALEFFRHEGDDGARVDTAGKKGSIGTSANHPELIPRNFAMTFFPFGFRTAELVGIIRLPVRSFLMVLVLRSMVREWVGSSF